MRSAAMLSLALLTLAACTNRPETAKVVNDTAVDAIDGDGDGFTAAEGDCDDANVAMYPGAQEACDGVDQDCDGEVDEGVLVTMYADGDLDGYGDPASAQTACAHPDNLTSDGTDCDDRDPAVHPNAAEACDGFDQDCDGDADENVLGVWYADADADGYGDLAVPLYACAPAPGWVDDAADCDDTNGAAFPGAAEVCNEVDDNCDSRVDEDVTTTWYVDMDGDGVGSAGLTQEACDAPVGYASMDGDCDDLATDVFPGADEVCNGVDDDCDGESDESAALDAVTWHADADGDGYGDAALLAVACEAPPGAVANAVDCDDADATVSPDTIWYIDVDGDGAGSAIYTLTQCAAPRGYVRADGDCDDARSSVHPGAIETCDDRDDDCDGLVDDADTGVTGITSWWADSDSDGYGDLSARARACDAPEGYVGDDSDCDDAVAGVHPGAAETCNDVDDDCDGLVDDDDPSVAGRAIWHPDDDADGQGDGRVSLVTCDPAPGSVLDASDCDDARSDVHAGAAEVCDGVDNDCDGASDEAGAAGERTFFADDDRDGLGDTDAPVDGCSAPAGAVTVAGDCDDADAALGYCRSCQQVLRNGHAAGDGVYALDACGSGSTQDYWCDMTSDGGGWTVAGWQAANATTAMGLARRGTPGGESDWSVSLACVPYSEIAVFNRTHGDFETQAYTSATWSATSTNFYVGTAGTAFKHGTYGPAASQIMMGCVGYSYAGGVGNAYACDNDAGPSLRGHLADYAGESCPGGRLDYSWAWADGRTCSHRGSMYTWGYALR